MTIEKVSARMVEAEKKYGPFTSMQEALGVIRLEYRELEEAIQSRDMERIMAEALDLAAPCLRLVNNLLISVEMRERSGLTTPPQPRAEREYESHGHRKPGSVG